MHLNICIDFLDAFESFVLFNIAEQMNIRSCIVIKRSVLTKYVNIYTFLWKSKAGEGLDRSKFSANSKFSECQWTTSDPVDCKTFYGSITVLGLASYHAWTTAIYWTHPPSPCQSIASRLHHSNLVNPSLSPRQSIVSCVHHSNLFNFSPTPRQSIV